VTKNQSARPAGPQDPPGSDARERRRRRPKPVDEQRCRWCGRPFRNAPGRGRPRLYCRAGCRQQAFLARKLAAAHGLGDDDVIVSRPEVEALQSHLYCLQAALEDVDRDLAAATEAVEVREALDWLLENCAPLRSFWIEPRALEV
jgi:hypothetical protein